MKSAKDIMKHVKSTANGGDRLPSIPPSKVFKGSKKDKRDYPKHKKYIQDED